MEKKLIFILLNTLGTQTVTRFLMEDGDNLAKEFVAAGTINHGDLVKLTSTGLITPAGVADYQDDIIGYAQKDGVVNDILTVVLRGFAIIQGYASAALIPGPVGQDAYSAPYGGRTFTQATHGADLVHGWSLDVATAAGNPIDVVIKY